MTVARTCLVRTESAPGARHQASDLGRLQPAEIVIRAKRGRCSWMTGDSMHSPGRWPGEPAGVQCSKGCSVWEASPSRVTHSSRMTPSPRDGRLRRPNRRGARGSRFPVPLGAAVRPDWKRADPPAAPKIRFPRHFPAIPSVATALAALEPVTAKSSAARRTIVMAGCCR